MEICMVCGAQEEEHVPGCSSVKTILGPDEAIRESWARLKEENPREYKLMIARFEVLAGGKYKKVTDVVSGKTFAVSVETIATLGLDWTQLHTFPEWNDELHGPRSSA